MIEVERVTKRYGTVAAVKDVTFTIDSGMVTGLLGPNGAGKTTLMKILTGYHYPSSGKALLDGISIEDDPVGVKARVGYLPENAPLYGDMTVEEYLRFVVEARGMPKTARRGRIGFALESCGLISVRSNRVETLSKGYRQRVGLAQAIIHDPPILILDEPTSGLDPNQILEIRSLIRDLGKRKTVILSTHILQEVEALCSRVLILNEGRIAAQGSPEEISAGLKGGEAWHLTLKGADKTVLELSLRCLGDGAALSEYADRGDGSAGVVLTVRGGGVDGERIFDWASAAGCKILSMERKGLSMEDIFVRLTSEGGAE